MTALKAIPVQKRITYSQIGKTIEHLHRVLLGGVVDVPVVNGGVSDQTQALFIEPLPVNDILIHHRRLQFRLGREIEDLNCSALSLEGNDVLVPVHDRTVRIDWPAHNIIVVLQIDDNDLWLVLVIELLPNADITIGF